METNQTSIKIIEKLIKGINPTTGELLTKESPYQEVEIIRALFEALEAMKEKTSKKPQPNNQGEKWTLELDKLLTDQFNQKISFKEIAKYHGRTNGAIRSRLKKMELI